jgi:hypothetical protein
MKEEEKKKEHIYIGRGFRYCWVGTPPNNSYSTHPQARLNVEQIIPAT